MTDFLDMLDKLFLELLSDFLDKFDLFDVQTGVSRGPGSEQSELLLLTMLVFLLLMMKIMTRLMVRRISTMATKLTLIKLDPKHEIFMKIFFNFFF